MRYLGIWVVVSLFFHHGHCLCRPIGALTTFPDVFPPPDQFFNPQGMFTSPNYPANYNVNEECAFEIVGQPGSIICVSFDDLSTGLATTDPILSFVVGSEVTVIPNGVNLPANRTFQANRVLISWVAGPGPTARGWKLRYEIKSPPQPVTRNLILDSDASTLFLALFATIGGFVALIANGLFL